MEMIKIDFTKSSEDGIYTYSDALHLPANHTYTEEQIEAMKQERFDRWLALITQSSTQVVTDASTDTTA